MQVLECPDCHLTLQRVEEVTDKNKTVGTTQLSKHCFDYHTLPQIHEMLRYTADLVARKRLSVEDVKGVFALKCPGCGKWGPQDSYLYLRMGNRTVLCCSEYCLTVVKKRMQ
jgi:hypothetical protein